jgi:transcriptional regulator with XRE-family HTH domain
MRQARERAGLSQEHLAANLLVMHGVQWHQTTVRRTESGERPIRLSEAIAVAELLGVPLGELAYDRGDDTPRVERVARAYAELARVRQEIDTQLSRLRREMTSPDRGDA